VSDSPSDARIPFSRAAARLRVGPQWLERIGWADPDLQPAGLLDSIDNFASPVFDASTVDPDVRDFYESTAQYDLRMRAAKRLWIIIPMFFYGLACRMIGQSEFPRASAKLTNRFVAIKPGADRAGRLGTRAWVRTHGPDNRRVLYSVIVAWHPVYKYKYMHTAVPMPGGNIASVMLMSTIAGGGMRHETREVDGTRSPAGVYFSTRFGAVPLPLSERIDVWPTHSPEAPKELREFAGEAQVAAKHTFKLFGATIMTLDYAFKRCH
jgi:hypothetical protein